MIAGRAVVASITEGMRFAAESTLIVGNADCAETLDDSGKSHGLIAKPAQEASAPLGPVGLNGWIGFSRCTWIIVVAELKAAAANFERGCAFAEVGLISEFDASANRTRPQTVLSLMQNGRCSIS